MNLSAIFTLKTHDVFIFMKRRVMQLSIILSVAILFTLLPNRTAESSLQVQPPPVTHELTLIFAGDIMQHMPQVDAAWNPETGVYNYDSCFVFIKPWLSGADLTIANFETTLAGKPYSGYPAFSSPDEIVNGMLNAGIDITGTANNHCCDRGRTGIERTISILDSLGMSHMGTYTSEESYRKTTPLIINKSGFRIAFLNYTYGLNGNPVPENNVVSLIEKDRILHDLTAARDSLVDKIIVFIHWVTNMSVNPMPFRMKLPIFFLETALILLLVRIHM